MLLPSKAVLDGDLKLKWFLFVSLPGLDFYIICGVFDTTTRNIRPWLVLSCLHWLQDHDSVFCFASVLCLVCVLVSISQHCLLKVPRLRILSTDKQFIDIIYAVKSSITKENKIDVFWGRS